MLDFEVLHDSTDGGHRYLHIGARGQHDVGLWLLHGSEDSDSVGNQTAGEPLLVLYTGDLTRLTRRLDTSGVQYWNLTEDPDSRSLHFRDLVGNILVAAQLHPDSRSRT